MRGFLSLRLVVSIAAHRKWGLQAAHRWRTYAQLRRATSVPLPRTGVPWCLLHAKGRSVWLHTCRASLRCILESLVHLPARGIMNIRVYSAPMGYLLVDGFTSAPQCAPAAQLVFSISGDRLPAAVAQMLECAIAQAGTLEIRETWANSLFMSTRIGSGTNVATTSWLSEVMTTTLIERFCLRLLRLVTPALLRASRAIQLTR